MHNRHALALAFILLIFLVFLLLLFLLLLLLLLLLLFLSPFLRYNTHPHAHTDPQPLTRPFPHTMNTFSPTRVPTPGPVLTSTTGLEAGHDWAPTSWWPLWWRAGITVRSIRGTDRCSLSLSLSLSLCLPLPIRLFLLSSYLSVQLVEWLCAPTIKGVRNTNIVVLFARANPVKFACSVAYIRANVFMLTTRFVLHAVGVGMAGRFWQPHCGERVRRDCRELFHW